MTTAKAMRMPPTAKSWLSHSFEAIMSLSNQQRSMAEKNKIEEEYIIVIIQTFSIFQSLGFIVTFRHRLHFSFPLSPHVGHYTKITFCRATA